MNRFKDIVAVICLVASFLGAIGLIVLVWLLPSSSPMVTNLLNILLFILSSISAVILGHYFTRIGTSEKIDTIATASTEKMLHLSLQLQHLSDYLRKTETLAEEESATSDDAGVYAYKYRIDAAADMAGSLASSNEAFRSDWLGIVSADTRQKIEKKYEKLRDYLQDAETYERLQTQKSIESPSAEDETRVNEQIREVGERIEKARRELPVQPVSLGQAPKLAAVSVYQQTQESRPNYQKGLLRISILRPVFAATGSGKMAPPMTGVPRITVRLLEYPRGAEQAKCQYITNLGPYSGINVHIKSTNPGVALSVGEYVFEYIADSSIGDDTRGE
jgi:hypothetical protein